jgi:hypothetical protein
MVTYETETVHVYRCLRCRKEFGIIFPVAVGPMQNMIHKGDCGGCGVLQRSIPAKGAGDIPTRQERCC